MPLTCRRFLGATALLGLSAGCAPAGTTGPAAGAPTGPPALDRPDAVLDWVVAHPDLASLLVDDGRGTVLTHLADRPRPVASANKVVHLAAYAQAVTAGRLDPAGRVPVAEWERWYVPGAEPDTHPMALRALGVTTDGAATWDDLAHVMIDLSDNAAADLFRATLGDMALRTAATAGDWAEADLPSFAGELLAFDAVPPGTDRRDAAAAAGRRYADDPAQRAAVAEAIRQASGATTPGPTPAPPTPTSAARPAPDDASWNAAARWWDGSPAGTARHLAAVHRAAATGTLGDPRTSDIVRGHLERGLADRLPDGVRGAGQKGGNYPGLITNAVTLRRADGTVGVSVLSLSGLPRPDYQELLAAGAVLSLSQQVLLDEQLWERLRTELAER